MADSDDGTSSQRDSHYNQQRSSLRSDKSRRLSSRPQSRTQSAQWHHDFTLREDTDIPALPHGKHSLDNGESTSGRGSRQSSRTGSRRGSPSRLRARTLDDFLLPDSCDDLNKLGGPLPVGNRGEPSRYPHSTLEEVHTESRQSRQLRKAQLSRGTLDGFRLPDSYDDLDEVAAPPPIKHRRAHPEDKRAASKPSRRSRQIPLSRLSTPGTLSSITALPNIGHAQFEHSKASRIATKLYTVSYLIFFSILGTLARLGLQWLTFYPGAPVLFSQLWANVGGTFIMGFLSEDRRLFRQEWGKPIAEKDDEESDEAAAKAEHSKVKKTIPLFIGLATGFCGSLTSFSSFIRDVFFALSNDLASPINHPYPSGTFISTSSTVSRNGGYSFLALLAVIITTIALCLSALIVGAHMAIFLDPFTPVLPFTLIRKVLDRTIVFLAFGIWLGAIIMAAIPPDRPNGPNSKGTWANETWRGQAIFACVFAPLGCLLRFYASAHLNSIKPTFPLGTFCVNVFGTAVLGMAYDLQHVAISSSGLAGGGVVSCQVLQGIMDGFCGSLTTVSTWMAEIKGLERRHGYGYAVTSVAASLAILIVVMGSVRWSVGWMPVACVV